MAYAPGPLAAGIRAHVLVARSTGPVTEPTTRDTLDNFELGHERLPFSDVFRGENFPRYLDGPIRPLHDVGERRRHVRGVHLHVL